MRKEAVFFLLAVLTLFVIGLSMVFNTSSAEGMDRLLQRSPYQGLLKQLLYAACGAFLALSVWFVGWANLLRLSAPLLLAGTVLLVLVFVPGIGLQLNGARRWLSLGGFSFQPSEFVRYLIPMYYIREVTRSSELNFKTFLQLLGKLLIPLALILIEPDNGTAIIIMATLVMLFMLTRVRLKYWALPLAILMVVGVSVASQMPHVRNRIEIYLHPERDLQGKGHQPYQAKIAAGSGGLFGKGLAESMQKLNYLPEARSDYIAAIFAEEFGFVGMLALTSLYMAIAYFGCLIAMKAESLEGCYLAAVITFLISFPAFLNLGVVSGLLPSKGTTLPFFSQGGSSLLANLTMVCVILNISQRRYEQA